MTRRRAGSTLAAMLAFSAISMPVMLLTSQAAKAAPAAAAASGHDAQTTVAIAITGMTPRQAAPSSTITVKGTLKNVSQQQISDVAVRLLSSNTTLSTVDQLLTSASELYGPADMLLPGASWLPKGQLQPGEVVNWSIHVKAKAIGMAAFGVYPLAAQAEDTVTADPLATSTTYLPYVPAKKGADGSTIPARTKISWIWPLIDKPLLSQPGQSVCQGGAQAQALAASLSSGRLQPAGRGGRHRYGHGDHLGDRPGPASRCESAGRMRQLAAEMGGSRQQVAGQAPPGQLRRAGVPHPVRRPGCGRPDQRRALR